MLATIIGLFFSLIEASAFFILTFTIFRIPIKYNIPKLLSSALTIVAISFVQIDLMKATEWAFITQILCYVLLIILIFNLPMVLGAIISIIGYVSFAIIQILLVVLLDIIGFADFNTINDNHIHLYVVQTLEFILSLIVLYFFNKYKLGFAFVIKRVPISNITNKLKLSVAGLIISSIVLMEIFLKSVENKTLLITVFSSLIVIFILGIILAYRSNLAEINRKRAKSDYEINRKLR